MNMKQSFLTSTRVHSADSAVSNSIQAALQRNPTYLGNISEDQRLAFRRRFANLIESKAPQYSRVVSEKQHCASIEQISNQLSKEFGRILINGRLNIGTSQKALNLYLKFLWCLDSRRPIPPHCPIDSIVLRAARLDGAWTKLDSIEIYDEWIKDIRKVALASGFRNLAEWELSIWQGSSSYAQNSKRKGCLGILVLIIHALMG